MSTVYPQCVHSVSTVCPDVLCPHSLCTVFTAHTFHDHTACGISNLANDLLGHYIEYFFPFNFPNMAYWFQQLLWFLVDDTSTVILHRPPSSPPPRPPRPPLPPPKHPSPPTHATPLPPPSPYLNLPDQPTIHSCVISSDLWSAFIGCCSRCLLEMWLIISHPIY